MFACPTRAVEKLFDPAPVRISYGMNGHNSVAFPDPETRRLSGGDVRQPTSTLLIADVAATYNHPPILSLDPSQTGYKHRQRANMLFFDGHAGTTRTAQTNELFVEF
jgi:prepilin-type processing-associated H-X9-DG protein